jgi:nitrate/TMAO reductase-like tetraheme cytochrome c subunit
MFKAAWRFFCRNPKRNTAILVVVMGSVAFAGVEYTATPTFCGTTCHIMDPYYVSWKDSTHRNVACVDCHIPPGMTSYMEAKLNGLGQVVDDLLNRTTMKPSASVSDFACLRSGCHVTEKLGKVPQTEEHPFKFDHTKHLDFSYKGIDLTCTTCHSHTSGESHFEVNKNICINCHLLETKPLKPVSTSHGRSHSAGTSAAAPPDSPAAAEPNATSAHAASPPAQSASAPAGGKPLVAPSACTACHDAPSKPFKYEGLTIDHNEYLRFGSQCSSCHKNATLQPRPIESAQCFECHTFGRERFTTVEDMHRVHAEGKHKVECFSCHGVIPHGPEAQVAVLREFDCMKCHQGQHAVQRGAYTTAHVDPDGSGEDDAVSPMFLVHVDCTGCHIQPSPVSSRPTSGATVNKAIPEACDACHQPGFGKQLVGNWQKSTHSVFDAVEALLPTDAKPWATGSAEAEKLVAEGKKLLELVRVDGSWGVHNPRYTEQLLEQARQKIMKARTLSGVKGAGSAPKESQTQ